MNTPPCSHRHDALTPGLVVRESLSVVSVELVLITACALMFSFISARENRQTTCPMPWTGESPAYQNRVLLCNTTIQRHSSHRPHSGGVGAARSLSLIITRELSCIIT